MLLALRVIMGIGSLTGVYFMYRINKPYHKYLPNGHIITRVGFGLLLISIAYGLIESQFLRFPFGPRLIVMAVAIGWINCGLWVTYREQRKKGRDPRIPWGI